MNRAWATLGAVAAATSGCIYFVHWRQASERARMHQGVLRDIAKEEEEKRTALAAALAQPVPADAAARACDGDICELVQTRFRDPKTGRVYTPAAAGAGAMAVTAGATTAAAR